MPLSLAELVRDIDADSTILLFGAGSSLPSNAPSVTSIIDGLSRKFSQSNDGFGLSEFTELLEHKLKDRKRLVTELRAMFKSLKPTAGLLNLPLYPWKSIYTTNYDDLIEQSYKRKSVQLDTISCNFDFKVGGKPNSTRLYKLHGTIEKDVSFGDSSRIILTDSDFSHTNDYRDFLYNALKADLAESNLIIIGNSLSDSDLRPLITKAIQLNEEAMSAGRITLLMYTKDDARSALYERRGLSVAYGGIDEFFAELAKKSPGPLFDYKNSDSVLERFPSLVPTVLEVSHQAETGKADVSRMFNGWPASYADIDKRLTFERSVTNTLANYIQTSAGQFAALLGASGVGKTTAIRQAILKLELVGYKAWEHSDDYTIQVSEWLDLARNLKKDNTKAVLFVDDAAGHLRELNELIDGLAAEKIDNLHILMASTRNTWRPRVKTPNFYKKGNQFNLSKMDIGEIDRLLSLVDTTPDLSQIVESSFSGFNRSERRRRLITRCEADMFVCMRNIFASESFDNIILREFADLSTTNQDIYRLVSALETSGVRVHRQLVIRLVRIPMTAIAAVLDNFTDIISEYDIDKKKHIYGWRGRHDVISSIITKYKFSDTSKLVELFEKVIDNLSPIYELEIRSAIDLCNIESGIPKIGDKEVQNRLLRKIMSVLPGERVPRHRLIRNLIELGHFDQAQTEIRIFEKDFRRFDSPVARLRIELLVARATETDGLMREDRLTILEQAKELAASSIKKHSQAKAIFAAYCTVGLNILRLGGGSDTFTEAMKQLREAERRLYDPEIAGIVRRFERLEAGHILNLTSADDEELGDAE